MQHVSTRGALLSAELQQGVEQHLLGAGLCETDGQLSPITAQLYATSSLWANHNGPEEANGNEACLLLANQERGVAESNSSGGKTAFRRKKPSHFGRQDTPKYIECVCQIYSKFNNNIGDIGITIYNFTWNKVRKICSKQHETVCLPLEYFIWSILLA